MHDELADLILAIGAHEQIEHGVQASFLTREVISTYLYEFDAGEVATAVDRLIQAGHLRQYEFVYRDSVVITGKGLQHYQQDMGRDRQPVQQPFQPVVGERQVEVLLRASARCFKRVRMDAARLRLMP